MILWETDTVVAITKPQLIKINRSLNDYIHLKEINRNLQVDLVVSDSLCLYWQKVALRADFTCVLERRKFDELTAVNTSIKSSLEKEKSKSRKISIGVGVGGTLLGILLGVLLAK